MYQALQQEYEALRSQGSRGGQLHNLLGDSPGNVNRSSGGGQLVSIWLSSLAKIQVTSRHQW